MKMKLTDIPIRVWLMMAFAVISMSEAYAQKDVVITGESVYYDDGRHSRLECMRIAAEQARIEALAREFGTIVTQDIMQSDRIRSGRETNDLLALSMTEVKGEWIGDVENPQYDITIGSDQNLVVKCTVKGKARAISNEAVQFDTKALRNGTRPANVETRFRDGDDLFLYFLGSEDGYLTVWLEDESRNVYNLLPYPRDTKSEVKLRKHKEYVFFNREGDNGEFGPAEAIELRAPDGTEFNRLYVVYSPNAYSRPIMHNDGELPSLASDDFNKWLMRVRRRDPKLGVQSINLEILGKD